jgi:elongator complex protein 3
MRDIPVSNILDGAKFSNLRQILKEQPEKLRALVGDKFYDEHNLAETSYIFRDIRAREVGFADFDKNPSLLTKSPVLVRRDYTASEGQEVFLSYEDEEKEHLFALLRLRKPSGQKFKHYPSALKDAAFIREVHSYGGEISVGDALEGLGQHRGLGRKMIEEAERIVRDEWKMNKISIIAGIGTREYYRKWGYEEKNTYMVKKLK